MTLSGGIEETSEGAGNSLLTLDWVPKSEASSWAWKTSTSRGGLVEEMSEDEERSRESDSREGREMRRTADGLPDFVVSDI